MGLGELLGRSWGLLGRSWGVLGRSWGALGSLLGGLGRGIHTFARVLGGPPACARRAQGAPPGKVQGGGLICLSVGPQPRAANY